MPLKAENRLKNQSITPIHKATQIFKTVTQCWSIIKFNDTSHTTLMTTNIDKDEGII